MMTSEMMNEMAMGKRKSFILIDEGAVQLMLHEGKKGLIVATAYDAAKKMAADIQAKGGKKVSVCEVGSAQGETLARHIALAVIDQGAEGIWGTDGTEGEVYFFQAPPVPDDDNEDRRRKFFGN